MAAAGAGAMARLSEKRRRSGSTIAVPAGIGSSAPRRASAGFAARIACT